MIVKREDLQIHPTTGKYVYTDEFTYLYSTDRLAKREAAIGPYISHE